MLFGSMFNSPRVTAVLESLGCDSGIHTLYKVFF